MTGCKKTFKKQHKNAYINIQRMRFANLLTSINQSSKRQYRRGNQNHVILVRNKPRDLKNMLQPIAIKDQRFEF